MTDRLQVETVSWMNTVPLNRREKIARWWVESVRQQHTYISRRQREQDPTTLIPIDAIDQVASDGLREALLRQRNAQEMEAGFMVLPYATPDGSQYFGSTHAPIRKLGVTFTVHGISLSDSDENY